MMELISLMKWNFKMKLLSLIMRGTYFKKNLRITACDFTWNKVFDVLGLSFLLNNVTGYAFCLKTEKE